MQGQVKKIVIATFGQQGILKRKMILKLPVIQVKSVSWHEGVRLTVEVAVFESKH